jgi:predicted nucleotidyltransferase
MYTMNEILKILRQHKPALQKKYPISQLGVFGSYARGEATGKSDIDIAVEISGPIGLSFVAMANEIETLFNTKVDVVPKRSIKPEVLPFVERDIIYV